MMCQLTLTAAFLGAANFCRQFQQCCNNGRSIKCEITIPCEDVVFNHEWTPAPAFYFPTKEYTVRGRVHRSDHSINVRSVSHYNEQFIPSFKDVGFEFRDISETFDDLLGLDNVYMMDRLAGLAEKQFDETKGIKRTLLTEVEVATLMEICEDFAESNNKKIVSKIENAAFVKVDGDGTKIHFVEAPGIDAPTKDGTRIKVWNPFSNLDNYPLAVGDARSYYKLDGVCRGDNHSIGKCATKRDFKDVVWYQQEEMTPRDAVFWNKHAVPHCSLNLGNHRGT